MPDIVYLLPLVVVVLAGIAVLLTRSRRRDELGSRTFATPAELQEHIRELCARGRRVEAVKVLRHARPGLGLKEATQIVEAVAAGGELQPRLDAVLPRGLPPALHEQVLALGENKKIHAIKLVREANPRISLKLAKDLVEAALRGAPPAIGRAAPRAIAPDLAERVRRLKAEGRREQAVFLVRGETGMTEEEANAFVDALQAGET